MIKQLPEVDAKIFENTQYKEAMVLSLKEAFRQNATGVVNDFKLLTKTQGFDLNAIRCPFVVCADTSKARRNLCTTCSPS